MDNGDKQASGFTKREAFAMAAMEGDWASQNEATGEFHTGIVDEQWDGRSELIALGE